MVPAQRVRGLCHAGEGSTSLGSDQKAALFMTKARITTTFLVSLLALAAGFVMLVVTGGLAYASDVVEMDGPDVVGVKSTLFGWTMITLAATAVLVMLAAAVGQLVAWVGAVLNTAQLEDKTWFVVLLLTGLLSFGFIAMIVYLVTGPEDPRPARMPQLPEQPGAMPTGRAA